MTYQLHDLPTGRCAKAVLFNRRLRPDEADTLMDMLKTMTEHGIMDYALGRAYLKQPEVVMFLSAVDDRTVGVTCVQKDRNRMGMVLSAVVVPPEHRRTSSYGLVKSSLPFFRTVSIRDVDALVAPSSGLSLGFPLNSALDGWTEDVLTRAGFEQEFEILQVECRLGGPKGSTHEQPWDSEANLKGAREMLWEAGRRQGLVTSLAWTALDFAFSFDSLLTASVKGSVAALAGVYRLEDCVAVTPALCDSQILAPARFASMLENLTHREGKSKLVLPLLGSGQNDTLRALEKGNRVTTRQAHLMRKQL